MHGTLRLDSDGQIEPIETANGLVPRFPDLSRNELRSLIELTVGVARLVLGAEGGTRRVPQYLWIFELVGRLKGALPDDLRHGPESGTELAPLALVFVDAVELLGGLPKSRARIQWSDAEAVMLEFEEIWHKRKFAKGSVFLDEAVAFAATNALGLGGNPHFVRVLHVAYHLQRRQEGRPILLPVSAPLATKLGTTPVTLGTAVSKAVREGYLEVVSPHHDFKAGKARTFRVNLEHEGWKPPSNRYD